MSNSQYNNPQWVNSQFPTQSQPQLEHEYDFMAGSVVGGVQMQGAQYPSTPGSSHAGSYSQFVPSQYAHSPGNFQHPGQNMTYNAPLGTPQVDSFRGVGPAQGVYGAPTQSQPTFNSPYLNKAPSQFPPLPYRPQIPHEQGLSTSPSRNLTTHANDGGLTPPHSSSSMQLNFRPDMQRVPSQSYFHQADGYHSSKRQRPGEDVDEYKDDISGAEQDGHLDSLVQKDNGAKPKTAGACARCKSLKVRCEAKTDTDPCKRCFNGGHECIIPGRKKRRVPPKREHLLNQIRDQAAEIQKLMAQLEATNLRHSASSRSISSHAGSSNPDLHSPTLDSIPSPVSPNRDVQDWIAKARESIEAFGGFIGMGGSGMTKELIVDEDPEDPESDGQDEYEFAIEESEGEMDPDEDDSSTGGRSRGRASSAGTANTKKPGPQKLATIPTGAVPFGIMAELALKKNRTRQNSTGDEDDVGVANANFFRPSPGPDPARGSSPLSDERQVPYILSRGIITPSEAENLFEIYFQHMNPSLSLLDPVLYTAQKTCWRSPFLFTVVCAIASRYYKERPELYSQVMHYAQLAAGTALISGQKSVEVCQAYILLALYPIPARRWDEDRSWIYLGLAIRIATDLNLHHPNTAKPLNEQHAREMLNRTRVWLNCFNLDRSTGSQYGKAPVIKDTDYVATHAERWWESSEFNIPNFDIHICAYNAELRVMGRFVARIYSNPEHPTGLNKEVDLEKIASETDDELRRLGEKWFTRLDRTDQADPQNCFRTGLLKLAYSYARLFALSFGFQHAFGKSHTDENPFLSRCLRAASDIVETVVQNVGRPEQRHYLRHGPEAQSVFVTFACAFLVKLLQPKFASYLTIEQRLEIRGHVQKVVDLLGSPEVAIDDRHGPKLYSRFLKGLLATPMAKIDLNSPSRNNNTLPSRKVSRKSRSTPVASPDFDDFNNPPSNHTSPSSGSLSPPPNTATMSFDHFAPVSAGVDPFAPSAEHISMDMQNALGIDMQDFFQPPLPFDNELLQSMQALSDPVWPDIALPGFNWMSQMQAPNVDYNMKNMAYDPTHHP